MAPRKRATRLRSPRGHSLAARGVVDPICWVGGKGGNVCAEQRGEFLPFLWTPTGTNQGAESCSFTPTHTTDTIIKLFSKPVHLDNVILLLKKKKSKNEIFNYIGDGGR